MDVVENALKELYVETYDELIKSSVYEQLLLDSKKAYGNGLYKELKNLKPDEIMKVLNTHKKDLEDKGYDGDTIKKKIMEIVYNRNSEITDKIKIPEVYGEVCRFAYLRHKLDFIEKQLKGLDIRAAVDNGKVTFHLWKF